MALFRKRETSNSERLITGIALLAIPLVMAIIFLPHLLKPDYEVEEALLDGEELHSGDYVTINVDAPLGAYVNTVHKRNFVKVGEENSYIIWLDDINIVSMTVRESDYDKLESMTDEFWDVYEGISTVQPQKVTFTGKVKKISSKYETYYEEALDEIGIRSPEFNIYYFDIDTTSTRAGDKTILIIFTLIGVIVGGFMILQYLQARKKESTGRSASYNGYSGSSSYGSSSYGNSPYGNSFYGSFQGGSSNSASSYGGSQSSSAQSFTDPRYDDFDRYMNGGAADGSFGGPSSDAGNANSGSGSWNSNGGTWGSNDSGSLNADNGSNDDSFYNR